MNIDIPLEVEPHAMLSYSSDGGKTFSSEIFRPLGKTGEHRQRAVWRRLGRFKERTIRLKVTDPINIRLIGANADLVGEG